MRKFKAGIAVCFFLYLIEFQAFSQTKQLEQVEVDLGSGVFVGTTGLPFDVPFKLTGDVSPTLRKVSVSYEITDKKRNGWGYFKELKRPKEWFATGGDEKKWTILVGPINPNVNYKFTFKVVRDNEIKSPERELFKESALSIIEDLFKTPIAKTDIDNANDQLNQLLKAMIPPGQTIEKPDGNPFAINLTAPPFNVMTKEVQAIGLEDMTGNDDLTLISGIFTHDDYTAFRTKLSTTIANPEMLSAESKIIWDDPVDPGIDAFKQVKFRDLAILIAGMSDNVLKVIKGTATIKDNSIIASTEPNPPSIELLLSFFHKLSGNLKNMQGENIFTNKESSVIPIFIKSVSKIRDLHSTNLKRSERRTAFIAKFPDVLADKVISTTYIVEDQSNADVVSSNTPYIGLDFGLAYIPGYSQLFLYEGVNFYFVPVNKDAPLSIFKGWNSIFKRLSIHMGLTQSLIEVENKRYQPLIKNVGSLMMGAGVRINRVMRLNTGYIFFYEKDNNPLLDKKHFTAMPEISFTIDINVARALGSFGKSLGVPAL